MKILAKLRKNQRKKQEKDPNPQSNLSPNLLDYKFSQTDLITANKELINSYAKYPIFIIQIIFVIFLILNFYQNSQLNKLDTKAWGLEQELLGKSSIYERARILNEQVKIYKQVETSRTKFSRHLERLISNLPNSVNISYLETSYTNPKVGEPHPKALIEVSSPDALTIALLISRFLDLDNVDQVVLHTATLDPHEGSYLVSMEVDLL